MSEDESKSEKQYIYIPSGVRKESRAFRTSSVPKIVEGCRNIARLLGSCVSDPLKLV
jgi:hypothetical protein